MIHEVTHKLNDLTLENLTFLLRLGYDNEGREDSKSELLTKLISKFKKELLVVQTKLCYLERRVVDTFGADQAEERGVC